jgi:hypothetical protein
VLGFDDYRQALDTGAETTATTADGLAARLGLPGPTLAATLDAYRAAADGRVVDAFGRRDCRRLGPPLYGVKVTGALFPTQGGSWWMRPRASSGRTAYRSATCTPAGAPRAFPVTDRAGTSPATGS